MVFKHVPGLRWLGSYERELACPRCRNVVAFVSLRPFSFIRIRTIEGNEVQPLGGWTLHQARQQVAEASAPGAADEESLVRASRRLAYLERSAGEVVYELTCPTCGATYLRSLPDLSSDIRGAPAGRVLLR